MTNLVELQLQVGRTLIRDDIVAPGPARAALATLGDEVAETKQLLLTLEEARALAAKKHKKATQHSTDASASKRLKKLMKKVKAKPVSRPTENPQKKSMKKQKKKQNRNKTEKR